MPPPTASQKPNKANGPPPTNGKAAAASTTAAAHADDHGSGKPDQAKYNAEQDVLNKEIAAVKVKLDAVRSRISLTQAPSGNDRRSQLRSEMDGLRGQQGKFKADRSKLFDEMKRLQESVGKKIKDAQAQRAKTGFKNVQEIDARIAALNQQVESGTMKLVDEKKALQEITQLRRGRKALESSSSSDDAIAAEKARIDELKKQLDDPEAKKVSDQFEALKKEMDSLRAEGDKAYQERNKLFDERTKLSKEMDELYSKKRELNQTFNEEKDKYYAKVQAIRQARQDRFKAEKAKEDAARRQEEISRMREEAKMPAYAGEIEDSRILINYFATKFGVGEELPSTNASASSSKLATTIEGVKALELRQVDTEFKGVALKKKGDDDLEGFFAGSGKGKKKGGKKGSAQASGMATPTSDAVNLPMHHLQALLAFGIQPPAGKDDVQRVVSDLQTKKAWFEANSESKTQSEIERVEKLVAKMEKKDGMVEPPATADADATGADTPDAELPADGKPSKELAEVDEELKEAEAA